MTPRRTTKPVRPRIAITKHGNALEPVHAALKSQEKCSKEGFQQLIERWLEDIPTSATIKLGGTGQRPSRSRQPDIPIYAEWLSEREATPVEKQRWTLYMLELAEYEEEQARAAAAAKQSAALPSPMELKIASLSERFPEVARELDLDGPD